MLTIIQAPVGCCNHLTGFAGSFMQFLSETGCDVKLKPFYVAIEALNSNDSKFFLTSVVAEVREPAKIVFIQFNGFLIG